VIACPYGFRVVGSLDGERRLVVAAAALAGYASCDERAQVDLEAYLSAFTYGDEFRKQLDETGSTRGYNGPCWSPWVWWDIDRDDDLEGALKDARRLAASILERYATLDEDDLLLFFSGSKGFHVGLPTGLWGPEPSPLFHRAARLFAEEIAGAAGVTIDSSIYDKVRAFRAPNSRHPKTGRYKRRLSYDELLGLPLDRILSLAEQPESFDLPLPSAQSDRAAADWVAAMARVTQQAEARKLRRAAGNGVPSLNRQTQEFIRNGAAVGDRHRLLFSAAANLAEFSCPRELAHALLTEVSLDCGLTPSDVKRQIDCGLDYRPNADVAA
jgi:hypothetical protein